MLWVTGAAGFIGGCFARRAAERGERICLIDKLGYAANFESIRPILSDRVQFHQLDIGDSLAIRDLLRATQCSGIVNFAAESHVDRSIESPVSFAENNVVATVRLLEESRSFWSKLPELQRDAFRFVQISTDEVFGALEEDGQFNESSRYQPNSPYSASKAAADHFARSYFCTYQFPIITVHSSNNFGPWQHFEKFIPTVIFNALNQRSIPIYGSGRQVRDWIYVDDNCASIECVLSRGIVGESYCLGANNEWSNLDLARKILQIIADETRQSLDTLLGLLQHVDDRPGHDFRYSVNTAKLQQLKPPQNLATFECNLVQTVRWWIQRRTQLT